MSGHKITTVTISQEEYRRLYNAERERWNEYIESTVTEGALFSSHEAELTLPAKGISTISDVENNKSDTNSREHWSAIENEVSQLYSRVTNIENDRQKNDNNQSFQNQINFLSHEIDQIINREMAEVRAHAENERKESQICQEYKKKFLGIYDSLFIEEYRDIVNKSDLEFFYEEYLLFESLLDKRDFHQAIGMIMRLYYEIKRLSMKAVITVDQMKSEYKFFYGKFNAIANYITTNWHTEAVNYSGEKTGVYLSLYDWSDGKYQQTLDLCEKISGYFNHGKPSLFFQRYNEIETHLLTLENSYHDAIITAHTNAINAQLKYEVANQVLLALIAQGYQPKSGDYVENEGKEIYEAIVAHPDGSEIKVTLDNPHKDGIGSRLAILFSNAEMKTRYEMTRRAEEVRKSVSSLGFDIGGFQEIQNASSDQVINQNYRSQLRV